IKLKIRSGGINLTCSDKSLPVDERNIVYRAASALLRASGKSLGADIHLEKNIPMGAGLGGGSSDAAAVLKGLAKLWKLSVSKKEISKIALSLGADVPFFLSGGTCAASGVGEKLHKINRTAPASYILIYPGFPVSTALAYSKLSLPLTKKQKINRIQNLMEQGLGPASWGGLMFNRLEEAVFPLFPELKALKGELLRLGCLGMMSGSGSTIFGLIKNFEEGRNIKSALSGPGRRIFLVETV
ncbi:MAG: 4-(cytidine 5'-diphospho)-2-C-methyl-D-erythritol kinase, partial [Elusimicrobia bacterium RIFOXYB1_FULL_48_9]